MNRVKTILSYIFGFLASTFVAFFIILFILNMTAFNKKYIISSIEKNNYYEELQKDITTDMKAYMMSSGLPEKILEDLISVNDVKEDTNRFLDSLYSGVEYKLDASSIKIKLQSNIDNSLKEQNITVTNNKMIDEFVDDIIKIYDDEIQLYGYTNQVASKFYKINQILNMAIIILGVLSVILIVVLLLTKFEYVFSIFTASGLIILFINFVINNKIDIDNITIISNMFSSVLVDVLNSIISVNNTVGVLLLVLGLGLTLVYILVKKNPKIS